MNTNISHTLNKGEHDGTGALLFISVPVVFIFLISLIVLRNAFIGLLMLSPLVILTAARIGRSRRSLLISVGIAALYLLLWYLFGESIRNVRTFLLLTVSAVCLVMTGFLTGRIFARMLEQQRLHEEAEIRDKKISETVTQLLTLSDQEELYTLTLKNLFDVSGMNSVFYIFRGDTPVCVRKYPEGLILYPSEQQAALSARLACREAGFGTALNPESAFRYLPVRGSEGSVLAVVGILMDWEAPPDSYVMETVRLILARVGIALDNLQMIRNRQNILMEKEMEHMRTDFLRAISHDFRTPLTSIIGACSALNGTDMDLSAQDRKILTEGIGEEAAWLLRMVENLLSVTRVGTNGPKLHKVPEPIEEVLAEAIDRTHKRFPALRLHIRQPSDFTMVPMDATLIVQVIMNLIENGAKYSRMDGDIDITAKDRGGDVIFLIRDYGAGLTPERLANPFSPARFRTGDSRLGMGLGLSICHSIIEAHGGTMDAYNDPQGGAVITFTLPKTTETAVSAEEADKNNG